MMSRVADVYNKRFGCLVDYFASCLKRPATPETVLSNVREIEQPFVFEQVIVRFLDSYLLRTPQYAMADPSTNFAYHSLKTLQEVPNKNILMVDGESFITGREFCQQVSNIVFLMKQSGFKPEDRVIIIGVLNTSSYCIMFAVLAAGGTIVVFDPSMGLERVDHCVATANPALWMWPSGSYTKWLNYVVPAFRQIPIYLEIRSIPNQPLMKPEDAMPVEHALVTFTTGSTGMPKLLMRKHEFLLKQSKAISFML